MVAADEASPLLARQESGFLPGSPKDLLEVARETYRRLTTKVVLALVTVLWLAFGVLFLTLRERFGILEALYLTVQVLTTIGYGDFPIKPGMEGFLSVYVIGCLIIDAIVISQFLQTVTQASSNVLRAEMRQVECRLGLARDEESAFMRFGRFNDLVAATLMFGLLIMLGAVFFATVEQCSCGRWHPIPGCEPGPRCLATGGVRLTLASGIYMSVVTLTTCGFGDRHPRTDGGMIFSLFWMLLGVAAAANFIRAWATLILESSIRQTGLLHEKISHEIFDEIDLNRDGSISRGEFMRYLLMKYNLVDRDVLDDINRQYEFLDRDGNNSVSFKEIQALYRNAEEDAA